MAGSLWLQGCAFIDVSIQPPPGPPSGLSSTRGRGREIALVTAFEDNRPDTSRCGMQKNGYNSDTANVNCKVPPGRWLANALAQGLSASGFVVTASPSPSPTAVRVGGDVVQFFVEPKLSAFTASPEADISVRLRVTSPSGLSADRLFYFKAEEVSMASTEDNFQLAADSATAQAVRVMVAAIADLLDRYPQVGAPTPVDQRVAEVRR
jgi:hypothetical protein